MAAATGASLVEGARRLPKDRDPGRAAAKLDRLSTIAHVEVNPASSNARPRVHDRVDAVIPLFEATEPDPRTDRQNRRVGGDGFLRRLRAGCRDTAAAIGGRGECQ